MQWCLIFIFFQFSFPRVKPEDYYDLDDDDD